MANDEAARDASLRERTYELVQSSVADDEDLDGAILLGFIVIAEWQAPNGDRWLSKVSGDSSRELPSWRERMFGFEVAHKWWPSPGDEPEENDE